MPLTEMEQDLANAMDNDQVDDKPNDIEADIEAALTPADEAPTPELLADDADETDETPPIEAKEDDEAPAEPEAKDAPEAKADKAPAGWTPANREHWAALPAGVKDQIAKREKEINTALQNGSQDRKVGSAFTQAAAPFQSIMAAEGTSDPIAAFKGLMNTAATLKMGSGAQKAQKIVDLIGHYGVDISTLDTILSGQQPAANPNSDVEKIIAERMKPMEAMVADYKQRDQQAAQTKNTAVMSEVEDFGAKHEFFADVRSTMADAIDMARGQGREMPLAEAYNFACNMNPEIKAVLDKRAGMNNLQDKKKAAASLNFRKGGQGGRETPQGLEDTIRAQWDGVA
jgi:hypothetical protein